MYDKVAKYMLKADDGLRNYILGALVGVEIKESQVLDDYLRPLEAPISETVKALTSEPLHESLERLKSDKGTLKKYKGLSKLVKVAHNLENLPEDVHLHDSRVDILCKTASGII